MHFLYENYKNSISDSFKDLDSLFPKIASRVIFQAMQEKHSIGI